ncbi:hypothetical protein H6776_00840 [Candidatus Nomurabacteria bacterium]|nr:hypothetical protein [Candidatus Nomurabacteria bacterium]
MSKYIRLNTTIVPDEFTQMQTFSFIEKLRRCVESEFFVSSTGPFPHITLYAPEYPESHIQEIESTLDGFPFTYYSFPHITLCKFSNRGEAEAVVAEVMQDFDVPDLFVESVGLFTIGTLGRCVGHIQSYNLLPE